MMITNSHLLPAETRISSCAARDVGEGKKESTSFDSLGYKTMINVFARCTFLERMLCSEVCHKWNIIIRNKWKAMVHPLITINQLPDKCMVKLFAKSDLKQLAISSQVCKGWLNIIAAPRNAHALWLPHTSSSNWREIATSHAEKKKRIACLNGMVNGEIKIIDTFSVFSFLIFIAINLFLISYEGDLHFSLCDVNRHGIAYPCTSHNLQEIKLDISLTSLMVLLVLNLLHLVSAGYQRLS